MIGEVSRILGRTYHDHSAYSLYGTLGKRSVAVDLKISQIVDAPNYTVSAFLPLDIFE